MNHTPKWYKTCTLSSHPNSMANLEAKKCCGFQPNAGQSEQWLLGLEMNAPYG